MMKNIWQFGLAFLLAGAITIAGCETCGWDQQKEVAITEQPEPEVQAAEMPTQVEPRQEVAHKEMKPAPKAQQPKAGQVVSSMYIPTGERSSSAILLEKMAPREVVSGVEFEYQLRVTNLSKNTLQDIRISEKLPSNMQLISASPEASRQAGTLLWSMESLKGQESQTITLRGTAPQTGELTSCTDITYRNPTLCLAWNAKRPELQITKAAPNEILICDPIVYKITVMNNGDMTAEDVRVREDLPSGLKTMDGQSTVEYDFQNLGPGQTKEATFRAYASETGQYTASASVSARHGFSAQSTPVSTRVTTPVLIVTKTAPEVRYLGRPLTYNITIRNSGDGEAKNTILEEVLGEGLEFMSASDEGQLSGNKVRWNVGNLASGQQKSVSVQVRASKMGNITSMAVATAYCATGDAEAMTKVKGIPAILLEAIDEEDPIELGAQSTYVIRVTNQGTAMATNVTIKCMLPAEMEFIGAQAPTNETLGEDERTITFAPLETLAPRASAVYRIMVKGTRTGDVRFRVQLMSDQIREPVQESESTNIYE